VVDFGLDGWLDAPGEAREFAPWHGRRAPELTAGAVATPAADIFGLGELVRVLFGASPSFERPRADVSPALWDVIRAATAASPLDRIATVEAFRARFREAWSASGWSSVAQSALPPEPVATPAPEPRADVRPIEYEPAHIESPEEYAAPTVMEPVSHGAWEAEVEAPEGATVLQEVYDDASAREDDAEPAATVALTVEAPATSAWNVTGAGEESTFIVEVPASRVSGVEPVSSPEIAPTDICAVVELPYSAYAEPALPSAPPAARGAPVVARPSAVTGPAPRRTMNADERRTLIALAALGAVIVALFVAIALSLARG
jgi:hypothetical protein